MENILNPTITFDVSLLEKVIQTANSTTDLQLMSRAQTILTQFLTQPNSYQKVPTILSLSSETNTRLFALQVMSSAIHNQWNTFTPQIIEAIKQFVLNMINQLSSDAAIPKVVLNKADTLLVELIKHLWPSYYPSFIDEVISTAQLNELSCNNSLSILSILAEDIYSEKLQTQHIFELKNTLDLNLPTITKFFLTVLTTSTNEQMLIACLKSLQTYIGVMTFQSFSTTGLAEALLVLLQKVNTESQLFISTLSVFVEISQMKVPPSPLPLLVSFTNIILEKIGSLQSFLTTPQRKMAFRLLTITVAQFLSNVQITRMNGEAINAIQSLVIFSDNCDGDAFFACSEAFLQILKNFEVDPMIPQREVIAQNILKVILCKMPAPREMLMVEENGVVVRRKVESINDVLETILKDSLSLLIKLVPSIGEFMLKCLYEETVIHRVLKICYSISAISSQLLPSIESSVFSKCVEILILKIGKGSTKSERVLLTGGLLVVISSYQKLLMNTPVFLHVVINKISEFMRDESQMVRVMAVNTFRVLCITCGATLLQNDILEAFNNSLKVDSVLGCLDRNERDCLFECFGIIIGLSRAELCEEFISRVFGRSHQIICEYQNTESDEMWRNERGLREAISDLKALLRTSQGAMMRYMNQIIAGVLAMYQNGMRRMFYTLEKGLSIGNMVVVLSDIIEVITMYLMGLDRIELKTSIHLLGGVIIPLFVKTPKLYRPASVVWLYANVMEKLGSEITDEVGNFYGQINSSCLEIIRDDMSSNPDIRRAYFKFLEIASKTVSSSFAVTSKSDFDLTVDIACWGIRHLDKEVYMCGLNIILNLLYIGFMNQNIAVMALFKDKVAEITNSVICANLDLCHTNNFDDMVEVLRRLVVVNENATKGVVVSYFNENFGIEQNQLLPYLNNVWAKKGVADQFKAGWLEMLVSTNEFKVHELKKTE
ncbi:chromosome region maintenance protein, putative [Entamoeba invadens IP1]|uniref:Chromosome region maintenance protein, putative n=1 Tax=Entamoeba invadens IP1 TaxID=370355 RepID=A0A0A1U8N7_ENTIV|nr:chromosome region maintenance protein, putative [Entamoeba invadens IP1]ELP91290.1 chromosome region maintenance protein, putative [Entamoeba invadens IP1]|eukprot:XP_004258061.1 chromosome region maintenance protein, putative [Entamoeba invadens IP1]